MFDRCIAGSNSPLPITIRGIQRFLDIGVDPQKLVLGIPWYGRDYPCEGSLTN